MLTSLFAAGVLGLSPMQSLKNSLDDICTKFHGRIGYCVFDIRTGQRIGLRQDERFPTASTIKTAVALEAIREIDAGKLKWSDQRVVPPMEGREASMWSYFFKDGTKVDVDGWVNLMLTFSDNTATIVLRQWLTPQTVNKTLAELNFKDTKVLWNFPQTDVENYRLRRMFGLGVTTPAEMNRLWELIYRRKAASEAGCERLMRILCHQYWDDATGMSVPVGTQAAIKNGAIDRSRSENAIVFAKNPYILAIYTDNQKDQRWNSDNEGDETLRTMCRVIYATLNPKDPYLPPSGYKRFLPTGGGVE